MDILVSIPERGLEALKLINNYIVLSLSSVSIPERVLEALKLMIKSLFSNPLKVSIPERVLEALKLLGGSSCRSSSELECFNP